jgi:hypothetical protein
MRKCDDSLNNLKMKKDCWSIRPSPIPRKRMSLTNRVAHLCFVFHGFDVK